MDRRQLLRLASAFPITFSAISFPAAAAEPASQPPRLPPRLVVIDPGHGGHDPGAIGTRGTREKDITLDIAQALAEQLRGTHHVSALLTRDGDEFLPLATRVARARDARADLFLSIHADSAPNHEARGLSAYVRADTASDDFAGALAARENLADEVGGVDLRTTDADVAAILYDLATRHARTAALTARQTIVSGAGRDLRLLDRPMRAANFAVLKAPDVPSVLIETGFLSNPKDEELLRNAMVRCTIARVLAREVTAALASAAFA